MIPFLFLAASDSTPGIHLTMDMLKTILDGVIANIMQVLPLAISIMIAFIGFRVIVSIVAHFTGG